MVQALLLSVGDLGYVQGMDIRVKREPGTHSVLVRIRPDLYPKLQAMADKLPKPGAGVATVIRMIVETALEEGVVLHPGEAATVALAPEKAVG